MFRRILIVFILSNLCLNVCFAQSFTEFEDANINAVNKLKSCSILWRYPNIESALEERKQNATELLNGDWKFAYCPDYKLVPSGFFQNNFEDALWTTIKVPDTWQCNGYDNHQYTNVTYPFPFSYKPA